MPYHVFARVKGSFDLPGDCDLETEEKVLENYCIPYLEGKPITIDGAKLTDQEIKKLIIFVSDLSSTELFRGYPNTTQKNRNNRRVYNVMQKNSELALNISSGIMREASDSIGGNIKSSQAPLQPSSINISGSTLANSPITGVMDHSSVAITVNKPEIEKWLQQITAEMKKNNVQNDELISAIETLNAALQTPKHSGTVIKSVVEAVKSIGLNLVSSAIWQNLMTHLPI